MHNPSPSILIGLLLGAMLAAAPGPASARTPIRRLCLEDLQDGHRLEQVAIPLGCQLIDCCVDCPSGPLTWRVRVSGAALAAVDVAFEGLPAERRIRVEGDGRATARGAAARRGETFIRNLHEPPDGSVAHASLELRGDPRASDALRGEHGTHVEVAIDQLRGDVVVNEFRVKAVVQSCVRPLADAMICDEVKLRDNRGGDSSVVLLDGLRGETCLDGELQKVLALGPLALPTLAHALLDGPSPAALFSVEHALRLRYRELAAFASRTPGARFTMTQDEFIDAYRDNYAARLQGRAAWALGEIEDPAAERALRKALGAGLRPDVQRGVQAALVRRARTP